MIVALSGPDGGVLSLQISDTGEGIPPAHLPHVFERFYRADPARPAGGTGLGLAIVKQLTEAQGGTVSVDSAPGRGSVFTVTLPTCLDLGSGTGSTNEMNPMHRSPL